MRRTVLGVVAVCVALLSVLSVRAQVAPLVYAPGWNLAGGPAGMDFAAAEGLLAYRGGSYVPADGRMTSVCTGYWAYFAAPQSVSLPATGNTTQTCPLQAGWTMVGNPFDDAAALPAGTVAYSWDPGTQSYVSAAAIPVGQAVWIWSPAGGSIALTSAAAGGVTVSAPPPPAQPVQLRVGQYLTVLVSLGTDGPAFVAHTDVPHLRFIDGSPVPGTTSYAYRWQAVSAGDTQITLDPACLSRGCAQPSFVVRITIVS